MLFVRDFLTGQTVLGGSRNGPSPLVSVILPTYRRREGGSLERAIASVLSQTCVDFELLVMDDGSTDGSSEVIEDLRRRDARVIHVRHERNCGLPGLRVNEGIELSRGAYLAFQFDDDCWRPNALQALTTEAARHAEPTVVVGHSLFRGKADQSTLPATAVDLVTLYEQNRFANNSVLVPKALVDTYGMYDCHIGMRRLCDWDLWLRYIKYVPFRIIDDVISDVFEGNPGSIGLTVPWDLPLFRFFHDIPRNHLLTPGRWRDYEVDALRVGEVEIERDVRRRLYEQHVVPYYFRFRHYFPQLEGFSVTLPERRKTVLYTKGSYDVSNDVTLNQYDALSNRRGNFKAYYEPLQQVGPEWTLNAEELLLVRTVEDQARFLMEQALAADVPAGFYLDDDLLTFHEYGSAYGYLAPGTPYHRNLCDMLSRVDTVWVTNDFIKTSVAPLNPRTIPHNNSVGDEWLPSDIRSRDPGRPLRIGYAGSGYRLEEFKHIWQALLKVAHEYRDRLSFEFWGLDVSGLPRLASPLTQRPFTFSYYNYLRRLQEAHFDILLTPLLDFPRPRLGKSLIKYYETAVAGALGIFSDVPQYRGLPAGLTCLKTQNTVDAWYDALREAVEMPAERFDLLRRRALAHVREDFTASAQIHKHEAAWRATEFHARTRDVRYADGRPRVMYVFHSAHFGGAEVVLWRRLRLARRYAIEPIVVLPRALEHAEAAQRLCEALREEEIQVEFVEYFCDVSPRSPAEYFSELERSQVRAALGRFKPALVHTVTFIASFGQICEEMKVPHVASLYAIYDEVSGLGGRPDFRHCAVVQSDCLRYAMRWGNVLGVEKFVSRDVTPETLFALGQTRHLESIGRALTKRGGPVRMVTAGTFQERKCQLEIIEAVGRLVREGWDCHLDLYGYTHFFPEYVEKCRQRVRTDHLEERVIFREFDDDMVKILETADVVLTLSTYESLPTIIKEATAAGVLVVATPVGGIAEVIVDGVSGIVCVDTSVEAMTDGIRRALVLPPDERERIIEQARRVARSEFHPTRVASDMMMVYNRAIEATHTVRPVTVEPARVAAPIEAAARAPSGIIEYPREAPASHLRLVRGVTYRLTPQRRNWTGLGVLVGTHQRPASGRLSLRVLSPAGHVLRRVEVDLATTRDNDWLDFRFAPIANAAREPFGLEFRLVNVGSETRLSLYEINPPEGKPKRLLRRLGLTLPGNTLYHREWYAVTG